MALGLAEAGADIVGLNRGEPGEVAAGIRQLGRRFEHVQLDLLRETAVSLQQTISHIVEKMGRLDILVNNAGLIRRNYALDYSEAHWDDVIQVNLRAAFFLAQAAARHMKTAGGGKIINVSSVLGFEGGLTVVSYTTTKHGIIGMTKALANEWASHHINVNAIAPGYFSTDMTTALRDNPERSTALLKRIPNGRFGHPDELKGIAVYLASSASSYAHGATFVVDGGWLAR